MSLYMNISDSANPLSLIDLTSSLPPTTASASTSQRDGGKTSYIWGHGKEIVRDGKDRWECDHRKRSYAICGSSTTNQRDYLKIVLDQSECEKVDLWLKINDLIGHHGFR